MEGRIWIVGLLLVACSSGGQTTADGGTGETGFVCHEEHPGGLHIHSLEELAAMECVREIEEELSFWIEDMDVLGGLPNLRLWAAHISAAPGMAPGAAATRGTREKGPLGLLPWQRRFVSRGFSRRL